MTPCVLCAGTGEVCPDCSRPERCECAVPRDPCRLCHGRGFLVSRVAGELRDPTPAELAAIEATP